MSVLEEIERARQRRARERRERKHLAELVAIDRAVRNWQRKAAGAEPWEELALPASVRSDPRVIEAYERAGAPLPSSADELERAA